MVLLVFHHAYEFEILTVVFIMGGMFSVGERGHLNLEIEKRKIGIQFSKERQQRYIVSVDKTSAEGNWKNCWWIKYLGKCIMISPGLQKLL